MRSLKGKTAVITGASQGLGAAIARVLGATGCRLVLVARNRERLIAMQREFADRNIQASIYTCDLADTTALTSTCNEILRTHESVDILINNAGVGGFGEFFEISPEDILATLQVPLAAALLCSRLLGVTMREQSHGHIVNIVSPAAYFNLPYMAPYTSARAGLLGFSRSLNEELKGTGVRVSSLCPAWVDTDYIANNATDKNWMPRVARFFPKQSADHVAGRVVEIIRRNKSEVTTSWLLQAFIALHRHLPRLSVAGLKLIGLFQPALVRNAAASRNQPGSLDWTNWEESISLQTAAVAMPRNVDDIIAAVKDPDRYPSPLRSAGSRHSTTHCAVTDEGTLLIMRNMERIVSIDVQQRTVTVEAGALYIDVAKALEEKGLQFYVNVEIGNLTLGSAACTGTKDASMPQEFGQVCSYCCAMKLVLPNGEILQVDEDREPELMQVLRSSYGLLGVIFEVTFRVKPLAPMVVYHHTYTLDEFERALPSLRAEGHSMMYYLYPFLDKLTVEFRHYRDAEPLRSNRLVWRIRNYVWKTLASSLGYLSTRYIRVESVRYLLLDGFYRIISFLLDTIIRSDNSRAPDQLIRYPEHKGISKYTFSIWAFPEEQIMATMRAYYRFCQDYYRDHGFRCDLLNVGYRIQADQNPLFSYSYQGTVMTLDPVATGAEGWNEFLRAYNAFCSRHGGVPLFNQSKWLTRDQVQKAFGDRIEKFWRYKQRFDPQDRLLNRYFKALLEPESPCEPTHSRESGKPRE